MEPPLPRSPGASRRTGRRPAAPLDGLVEWLWVSERPAGLAHPREWNLPTALPQVVVPLHEEGLRRYAGPQDGAGSWLLGGVLQPVTDRPSLRDTSRRSIVVGAQLRGDALPAWTTRPAHEGGGAALALEDVLPGLADSLQTATREGTRGAPDDWLDLLETALLERVRPGFVPDPLVRWATGRLASGAAVGELRRTAGCSPATLIARYRAACGLTPKRHASLMRFASTLPAARGPRPWSEVALAAGYADQSHLTRTFARFAGMTPTQVRRAGTDPGHVAVEFRSRRAPQALAS